MASLIVQPSASLQGTLTVPGDKSISHRALLLGAISEGPTQIRHSLSSGDVEATRRAVEALGVSVRSQGDALVVDGKGPHGLRSPDRSLDMGNSGTTTRLLLGLLSGHPFPVTLTGDASLSRRPMRRVTEPLEKMGARIEGPNGPDRLPLTIQGGPLRGIDYTLSVPSAQVKSALLLAALYAKGNTTVTEPILTRDHTERMLRLFGAKWSRNGLSVTIEPGTLKARDLTVPGDLSSATFFLVGAILVAGSSVMIRRVGLNPTRTGLLEVLEKMGARLSITGSSGDEWEPVGDLSVSSGPLQGVTVESPMIPRLVDELPILMVAASQAEGLTVIQDAAELRVKETDRIQSMVTGLTGMGAKIRVEGDSIFIEGPTPLKGARVDSFGDHRTAMALAVAALVAKGPTTIEGTEWVDISFPGFFQMVESLRNPL